jgi:hypothetical protein
VCCADGQLGDDAIAFLRIGLAVARRIVGGAGKWHVDEKPIAGFGPLAAFVVGPAGDGAERMTVAEQARDRLFGLRREPVLRELGDDRVALRPPGRAGAARVPVTTAAKISFRIGSLSVS